MPVLCGGSVTALSEPPAQSAWLLARSGEVQLQLLKRPGGQSSLLHNICVKLIACLPENFLPSLLLARLQLRGELRSTQRAKPAGRGELEESGKSTSAGTRTGDVSTRRQGGSHLVETDRAICQRGMEQTTTHMQARSGGKIQMERNSRHRHRRGGAGRHTG